MAIIQKRVTHLSLHFYSEKTFLHLAALPRAVMLSKCKLLGSRGVFCPECATWLILPHLEHSPYGLFTFIGSPSVFVCWREVD